MTPTVAELLRFVGAVVGAALLGGSLSLMVLIDGFTAATIPTIMIATIAGGVLWHIYREAIDAALDDGGRST